MHRVWAEWGIVVTVSVLMLPVAGLAAVPLARRRRAAGAPARRAWRCTLAELGMVCGTLPWIWMILTPNGGGRALSLQPVREFAALVSGDPITATVQIGGNLLVFAAFGALAPIRWRIGMPAVLGVSAVASLTVETLQYLTAIGRVSSIDDILLNTAGAGLAALVTKRWWRRRRVRSSESGHQMPADTAGRRMMHPW